MDPKDQPLLACATKLTESLIDNMVYNFGKNNLCGALKGLERCQIFFHVFEAFGCSPHHPKKLSQETAMRGLTSLLDAMKKWVNTDLCNTPRQIGIFLELNLPFCFQVIFHAINEAAQRISAKLLEFEGISEYKVYHDFIWLIWHCAVSVNNNVQETFAGHNHSRFYDPRRFQFRIATVDEEERLPENCVQVAKFLISHGVIAPKYILPANSPTADTLRHITWSEVIKTSTESFCQRCRGDLESFDSLAVLQKCCHVSCGDCAQEWFTDEKKMGHGDWSCPTCLEVVEEFGTIARSETKVLQRFIPVIGVVRFAL